MCDPILLLSVNSLIGYNQIYNYPGPVNQHPLTADNNAAWNWAARFRAVPAGFQRDYFVLWTTQQVIMIQDEYNLGWATISQYICTAPFYCVRYVKENCLSSVNAVVKSFYDDHSWFNSFIKAEILDEILLSFLRDLKHSPWFGVNFCSIPKMITIQ